MSPLRVNTCGYIAVQGAIEDTSFSMPASSVAVWKDEKKLLIPPPQLQKKKKVDHAGILFVATLPMPP